MKNIKLLLSIFFGAILVACGDNARRSDTENNIIYTHKDGKSNEQNNTVNEKSIEPYKSVDSVLQVIDSHFDYLAVERLDSLCQKSDGDLSEVLGDISVEKFRSSPGFFVEFFANKPNSFLRSRLIDGYAGIFSVYEKSERGRMLRNEEREIIDKLRKEKVRESGIKIGQGLFREIDPDLLD